MGAHTLGVAHSSASGFDDLPWVGDPGILDNQFYIDLADTDAQQYNKIGSYTNGWEPKPAANGQNVWLNLQNTRHPYLMFNSDMCLWYDIDGNMVNKENGQTNQAAVNGASPVRYLTREYIQDNQKWLDDFADIWEIMVQTGYTGLSAVNAGNGRDVGGSTSNTGSGSTNTGFTRTKTKNKGGGKKGGRGGGKKNRAMSDGSVRMIEEYNEERSRKKWWEGMETILGWFIVITGLVNLMVFSGLGIKALLKRCGWFYESEMLIKDDGEIVVKKRGYESVSSLEH